MKVFLRALFAVLAGALLVGTAVFLLPGKAGAFAILAVVAVLAIAETWQRDVFRLIEARTDAAASKTSSRATAQTLLQSQKTLSLLLSAGTALKVLSASCATTAIAMTNAPDFLIPLGGALAGAALPVLPVMLIANHVLRELEVSRRMAEASLAEQARLSDETASDVPAASALKRDAKLKKFSKVLN